MSERRVRLSMASFCIKALPMSLSLLTVLGSLMFAFGAQATVLSREQDILDLKLGQRIRVDDGTCPAGQVKEVSGAKMTETGVLRARKCVPRTGPKIK
jgi:hypothetical protein